MEEPSGTKDDFEMVDQSETHITAESETVDTQMEMNRNGDGEKELKSSENITNVLSGKRFFVLLSGNTLNVHKAIIDHLTRQTSDLQNVSTVDDCDFILVFCPVVSRAGTDIEAAVQKLHSSSGTKPAVLVVLHHTFDPECVVPNSSRAVHRENTVTVDCLFHEDKGLLQCHKNYESLTRITEMIQSQASSSWLGWWFSGSAPKEKTQCEHEEGMDKSQTESGSEGQASTWWFWPGPAPKEKTKCENEEGTDKDQTESGSEASVSMWCPFLSSAIEEKNLCDNEEGNEQGQTKSRSEDYVMICSGQPASAAEKKLCGHEKWKHKGLTYRKSGELRLMLLGSRSVQTAVKNIILGREDRNQAVTPTSTQQSENTQGEVAGRKVIVMDTPDWFSPGICLEERLEKLENVDSLLHSPGPHAFLLVLHANQPTGEKKSFIEEMVETLGASCWQNTMIIFIVSDKHQRNNQSGDQEIQKSGKEVFCLNIKESGECSQVADLLEKIEKMVNRRGEKIYSSDIYKHTLVQVRTLLKSIREKLEKCKDQIKRDSKEKMRKLDLPEELQQKMEMKENVHIARTEEERNIMKIILPEIWKNILESNVKMHEKFSRQEEGQTTCKRPHEEEDKKIKYSIKKKNIQSD
ncbi:uncharacterized protein LOC128512211 isoform X3 [Clarias gariepinus]|uniref:uncharacterized protein LOC128512211 isoform X3 n=1 Tax=Clarias gariepinus TaxID=13013 RepID=UPI00234D7BC5|nr:uncharacterized protein LOC128512211 isoform X3 [Clarias gariepinus]